MRKYFPTLAITILLVFALMSFFLVSSLPRSRHVKNDFVSQRYPPATAFAHRIFAPSLGQHRPVSTPPIAFAQAFRTVAPVRSVDVPQGKDLGDVDSGEAGLPAVAVPAAGALHISGDASSSSGGQKKYAVGMSAAEFEKHLADYTDALKVSVNEEIEQSSRKFRDFTEVEGDGMPSPWPAGVPNIENAKHADYVHPHSNPPDAWKHCDTSTVNWFGSPSERICLQYMRNIENIAYIKPMSSILATGRTIKFKVTYRDPPAASGRPPIRAVAKISQYKFLLEPCAESASWAIDRLLDLRRVPPTPWTYVPAHWMRAAAASTMGPFYSQWLEGFVFQHPGVVPHLIPAGVASASKSAFNLPLVNAYVPLSLQLWIEGLKHYPESSIVVPHNFPHLLSLSAKDKGPPDGIYTNTLSAGARHRLGEASDLTLFDFIITNGDRRLFRNNAVFGDVCTERCQSSGSDVNAPLLKGKPGVPASPGYPVMVFIDQGSSFYRRPGPEGNPYTPLSVHETVPDLCRIRQSTYLKMHGFSKFNSSSHSLYEAMMADAPEEDQVGVVPPGARKCIRPGLLKAAQDRMDAAVAFFDSCLVRT